MHEDTSRLRMHAVGTHGKFYFFQALTLTRMQTCCSSDPVF